MEDFMKIFEKRYCENLMGCWYEYYLFGIKIHKKIIFYTDITEQ